jgi:two-component system nitrogen regulation sensor histidine kinase NtrY
VHDTIIRQVGYGRMVDEFSSFARMPAPAMQDEDIVRLCRQAVFLQQSAHPAIVYEGVYPDDSVRISCDGRQVSQALTNLLQNAADSIDGRDTPAVGEMPEGRIWLRMTCEPGRVVVGVEATVRPADAPAHRLTEPYVTTRQGPAWGLPSSRKSWRTMAAT